MKLMVSIIGAGALGSALGKLIDGNASINYLDKEDAKVRYAEKLTEKSFENAIKSSGIVFICTPSSAVRAVLIMLKKNIKENTVVVCLAKGIEESTNKTMDLLMEGLLEPQTSIGLLYGSMLATEINSGQPSFAHFAINKKEDFEKVNSVFIKSNLYVKHYQDSHSIAIAGVLKNVYAVAMGMVEGLGYGNNLKGYIAALSFKEMKFILHRLGNLSDEVEYSFLSDFITTGFSTDSRNYTTGYTIAKDGKNIESEGTKSLPPVLRLLGSDFESLHLLMALESIVVKEQDPKKVMEELIKIVN